MTIPATELQSAREFTQPLRGHRDWYSFEAIRAMPRLILMADKNPFSKTYGSFDRSFWHYRTMDFPCGMHQEFVLPLALAYALDMPNNPYAGEERLKELALAGIRFADKSSYPNGTCDDYFPFERALGALVFSLYSMTESCLVLNQKRPADLKFFAKRGEWLMSHNETGQLANHQAFAALALYNVYLLTDDKKFLKASNQFRDLTLSWQKPEGWFQEYEGADPGYHSCLIGFLAKLWQKSEDDQLLDPLEKAVDFAHHFMHPDGSYAGEYGSRNTFHFYPHGFEVLSQFFPKAGEIAESFLQKSMPDRRRYYNDDDRMAAHYVYDWMQAWADYNPKRQQPVSLPTKPTVTWLKGAKLFIVKTPSYHAVVAGNKGGTFKVITPQGPLESDTGLIGRLNDGKVVVTHVVDNHASIQVDETARKITIVGKFQKRSSPLPTPFKQIIFRVLLLTIGRFDANLVRRLLQKILITGKNVQPIGFSRSIEFGDQKISVFDEVRIEPEEKRNFKDLAAGSDATSIYVANSNVYQDSVLIPWKWFTNKVRELNEKRKVQINRTIILPPKSPEERK
ncbi:MAG: hypothetical protein ACFCU1_05880 [Sumerlaeia bacterium]